MPSLVRKTDGTHLAFRETNPALFHIGGDGCLYSATSIPAECRLLIGKLKAELGERSAQVDALTAQVNEAQAEKSQLAEKVASVNSLLEATQADKAEDIKVTCTSPVQLSKRLAA